MIKQIAVITGTRAEYGILMSVLDAIAAHKKLELKLLVTGTHLTTRSAHDIQHPIAARVRMQRRGAAASRAEDVQALSRGVAGFGKAFAQIKPDVVLVIGDRIEALAGALAGQVGGFRVAHIHGGDRAEGVADEAMRHATSKLAHLHFAATAQSRRRLVRMGENPEQVYNTGSPAIDALRGVTPADDAPDVIVMHHPVGAGDETERRWMDAVLKATAKDKRIVMAPNHDPGRNGIMQAIQDHGIKPIDHLPRERFLSLLAGAGVLVGNSSAGLIEAAALGTAAVNLGTRQAGRERPRLVVDVPGYAAATIRRSVRDAGSLLAGTRKAKHPYGDGRAGERIADLLATIKLDTMPLRKRNAY